VRKIGIIGGGQLGRMAIEEAGKYLAEIEVLTPEYPGPASDLAHVVHIGSLLDREAVLEFASEVDVLSYEIEHVDVAALRELEAAGKPVLPGADLLAVIQDKAAQKALWDEAGLPSAPWALVEGDRPDAPALVAASAKAGGFPLVQKARRGGYDGRGVKVVGSEAEARALEKAPEGEGLLACPSLVEAKVDFVKELAVVVARSPDGATAVYPCVEMVFDPRVNMCDSVLAPAEEPPSVLERAREVALSAGGPRPRGQARGRTTRLAFCRGRRRLWRGALPLEEGRDPRERGGPTAAQLGPLQHRGLRVEPVRPVPQDPPRPAIGQRRPPLARHDGQPPRRPRLACRRA